MIGKVKIFVSYSHKDTNDMKELQDYLTDAVSREEDVEFWKDDKIRAGEIWNDEIEKNIWHSDIALALVSTSFLESAYCKKEIDYFNNQKSLVIPIILSKCEWQSYDPLNKHQGLPGLGKNIKEHYTDLNCREQLFAEIFKALKNTIALARTRSNYQCDVFITRV